MSGRTWVVPIVLLALAACGGGGATATNAVVPSHVSTPAATATAQLRLTIPKAPASASRLPNYIPAAAQSVRIAVATVNGAPPIVTIPDTIVALAAPACTTTSGGLSCSITVNVPVANAVVLSISMYATTDGTGSVLSTAMTPPLDTTVPNASISVSIGGVASALAVSASHLTAPADGTTHVASFSVRATDASGATILPPGAYNAPISIAVTGDANGALSVSPVSIASPPANGISTVTISYDSTKALTAASLALTSGAASATVAFDPLIFTPRSLAAFTAASTQTVTVSEAGYGGAFAVTGLGSLLSYACAPAACAPSVAGGNVVLTFTSGSLGGSGSFTLADTGGTSALVPFTVTGLTSGVVTTALQFTEYPTPSSNSSPASIVSGPDGHSVLFAEKATSKFGRIDTISCCAINEYSLGSASSPLGMASGFDGNVYVSAAGNGSSGAGIYQITPLNGVAPIPLPTSGPIGPIASASDGQIIAGTTSAGNEQALGFYTSSTGSVATSGYDMYKGYAAMATSPRDNSVWFTDNNAVLGAQVGNITCNSSICSTTSYSVAGVTGSTLAGITGAPDGMIWIVQSTPARIARIDPTSCSVSTCTLVTLTTLPTGSAPQGIAVGPDGNLWFTESGVDKIGVVNVQQCTTTCPYKEFAVPGTSGGNTRGLSAIATGPDGNLWVVETTYSAILKVVL